MMAPKEPAGHNSYVVGHPLARSYVPKSSCNEFTMNSHPDEHDTGVNTAGATARQEIVGVPFRICVRVGLRRCATGGQDGRPPHSLFEVVGAGMEERRLSR